MMIRLNKVQMEEKLKLMMEFLNSVEQNKQREENGKTQKQTKAS